MKYVPLTTLIYVVPELRNSQTGFGDGPMFVSVLYLRSRFGFMDFIPQGLSTLSHNDIFDTYGYMSSVLSIYKYVIWVGMQLGFNLGLN